MNCPTTNRKNEHPHEIRLENGKKQSRFTAFGSKNQCTKQLLQIDTLCMGGLPTDMIEDIALNHAPQRKLRTN